ncbi:MAG: hypothetical protein CMJ19_16745 [Phycisphaeraceae bacterium]|nr:hypothetical protein [Phycisphaeraceae bacterium]
MFMRMLLFQRRQPIAFAVMLAAVCCTLFVILLPMLLITRPDSAGNLASLLRFYFPGYLVAWGSLTLLVVTLSKRMVMPTVKQNVILIFAVAVILRLFTVFAASPQLSDDIWRYIHDGQTLASGDNPYRVAPAELAVQNQVTQQINHPDLVTIYQPTSQWVFAALAMSQFDQLGDVTFRLGFVLFDLAVIALIIMELVRLKRSVWWSLCYAWHPLVISEVAATGHQDVIGIAMLLACICFVMRRGRRLDMFFAGVCFAMSVAVKPIVFPLILPLVWELFRTPVACSPDRKVMCSKAALVHATFGAVLAGGALYLPFVNMPGGITRLMETGSAFVEGWQFNSLIHGITMQITPDARQARWIAGGFLMYILITTMRKRCTLIETSCIYLFASLLCSSTVYPWYLLWALAFFPLCSSMGLWVLSLTIVVSYEVLGHQSAWQVPIWVWVVTWVPVLIAVAWDLQLIKRPVD